MGAVNRGSEAGALRKSLGKVSPDFFHFPKCDGRGSVPANALQELLHKIGFLFQTRLRHRPAAEVIPALPDQPGIAQYAPAHHDGVHPGFPEHPGCIFLNMLMAIITRVFQVYSFMGRRFG